MYDAVSSLVVASCTDFSDVVALELHGNLEYGLNDDNDVDWCILFAFIQISVRVLIPL